MLGASQVWAIAVAEQLAPRKLADENTCWSRNQTAYCTMCGTLLQARMSLWQRTTTASAAVKVQMQTKQQKRLSCAAGAARGFCSDLHSYAHAPAKHLTCCLDAAHRVNAI